MRPSVVYHRWLGFSRCMPPGTNRAAFHMKNVAHSLLVIQAGSARGRWICRGKEEAVEGEQGAVRFHPADGERHVLAGGVGSRGLRFAALIIPPADIPLMAAADGVSSVPDLRPGGWPNDAVLRRCVDVLMTPRNEAVDSGQRDEAARSLVLRVAELLGAAMPDWRCDQGGFPKRTLHQLVEYVDAHLKVAPSAGDMALLVGLSPSHFARKFRTSMGMPLHRFVTHRRVQAGLGALQNPARPITHIALDLGFSSQSHFTRVFADLTGMTPAKYQKQFRPTVG